MQTVRKGCLAGPEEGVDVVQLPLHFLEELLLEEGVHRADQGAHHVRGEI